MPKEYKKLTDCPKELQMCIDFANLLPLSAEMPDIYGLLRNRQYIKEQLESATKERKEAGYIGKSIPGRMAKVFFYDYAIEQYYLSDPIKAAKNKSLRKLLADNLSDFPNDFLSALKMLSKCEFATLADLLKIEEKQNSKTGKTYLSYAVSHEAIGRLAGIYNWIRDHRISMLEFLDRLEAERAGTYRTGGNFPVTIPATIRKDKNGKYYVDGLAGLIGKFDVDRLQLCPVCDYIFWMKRDNSKTCGKAPCVNKYQNARRKNKNEKQQIEAETNK